MDGLILMHFVRFILVRMNGFSVHHAFKWLQLLTFNQLGYWTAIFARMNAADIDESHQMLDNLLEPL